MRKCHWEGCTSGARWIALLHIECQAPGLTRVLGFNTTVECCDEHREKVRPYVLADANRERLTALLMDHGYPEPNFLTARIDFSPIAEARDAGAVETCNRSGCSEIATWRIVQAIPHVAKVGEVVRLRTGLCVCDAHKAEATPDQLLDPQSRAITHKALKERGIGLRSLDRMKLEFEALRGTQ